jgi:hypothetical protein
VLALDWNTQRKRRTVRQKVVVDLVSADAYRLSTSGNKLVINSDDPAGVTRSNDSDRNPLS